MLRGNALVAMENMALWHERDISHSSTERVIIPDSTILLDYMIHKMIWVIDNLVVNEAAMLENINKSYGIIFSQRLLLAIVGKGKTREEAYKVIQSAAMKARESRRHLKEIALNDQAVTSILSKKEIEASFDMNYYLRNIDKIFKRNN